MSLSQSKIGIGVIGGHQTILFGRARNFLILGDAHRERLRVFYPAATTRDECRKRKKYRDALQSAEIAEVLIKPTL